MRLSQAGHRHHQALLATLLSPPPVLLLLLRRCQSSKNRRPPSSSKAKRPSRLHCSSRRAVHSRRSTTLSKAASNCAKCRRPSARRTSRTGRTLVSSTSATSACWRARSRSNGVSAAKSPSIDRNARRRRRNRSCLSWNCVRSKARQWSATSPARTAAAPCALAPTDRRTARQWHVAPTPSPAPCRATSSRQAAPPSVRSIAAVRQVVRRTSPQRASAPQRSLAARCDLPAHEVVVLALAGRAASQLRPRCVRRPRVLLLNWRPR